MRITRAALLLTAFALFLAAYLVVRFDDPAVPPAVPIVFLVALALPSYVALVRWLAGGNPASLPVLIYPAVPLALLLSESLSIGRVYWCLSFVNTDLGGLFFLLAPLRTVAW
ncbi:MAG: hypothetical protein PHP43_07990 [Methanoculleus sp.]|nr:hypothetical protein [Methanoculleus sp.]